MKGHEASVESTVFSPDGQKVISGSFDKSAKIWDAESGKELLTLKGYEGTVASVAFSLDEQRVISASYDHSAINLGR